MLPSPLPPAAATTTTTTATNNEGTTDDWGQHDETDISEPNDAKNGFTSQKLREMANQYFSQREYDSALPLYTMALEALVKEEEENDNDNNKDDGEDGRKRMEEGKEEKQEMDLMALFLCNRAACLFRMELYEDAKKDALQAVEISEGNNVKASFRLAKTQIALKEYTDAITTLETALAKLDTLITAQDGDPTTTTPNTTTTNSPNTNQETYTTTAHTTLHLVDENPTPLELLQTQKNTLQHLLTTARTHYLSKTTSLPTSHVVASAISLRTEPRKPSVREFDILETIGEGNFSRVVVCCHKVTKERFALKIIEKKKAEGLAKQQHPNVYNEIDMERRILGERLREGKGGMGFEGYCERVVMMYHAFQDYNSLYFLMDMYDNDLWSNLRYKKHMVGIHPSLAKVYLFELLEALEFLHSRGIVHRDLKAENMLLTPSGHLKLIDFGTAKDLIKTDLNGPEFVGTPDFMSPEAVTGSSGDKEVQEQREKGGAGSDHTLDLWEFGAVVFQLLTGSTPFCAPSPYLAFLRIQRGILGRPLAISDDDAWDLIERLCRVDPKERLGADCFQLVRGVGEGGGDGGEEKNEMIQCRNGYDVLRNHPYFASINAERTAPSPVVLRPLPSLQDLALRAVTDLVQADSVDLDIDKNHPPGNGSSHDLLRLKKPERDRLMGLLEQLRLLANPRVYRRFFETKAEARLSKVKVGTRDYVGLTQMIDKQHMFPTKGEEGGNNEVSDVLVTMTPVRYIILANPLFLKGVNTDELDPTVRKQYIAQLKESLKHVNKMRPKLVVASGYIDDECRRLLSKVNETIPVVINDGSTYYSFWCCGGQGLVLDSRNFITTHDSGERDSSSWRDGKPMRWLKMHLEQIRTARHHGFVFLDCGIEEVPKQIVRLFAKSRVMCLFTSSTSPVEGLPDAYKYSSSYDSLKNNEEEGTKLTSENESFDTSYKEEKNEEKKNGRGDCADNGESSSDSDAERSMHTMKIVHRSAISKSCCITLEEYGEWKTEDIILSS